MPAEVTVGDLIEPSAAEARTRGRKVVGKLADLLESQGIDVEDIGRVQRVNAWQGFMAKEVGCEDCNGTGLIGEEDHQCSTCGGKGTVRIPEKVDMVGISIHPKWAEGPQWPVVQPAKPTIVRHTKRAAPKHQGRVTVILPDPQIGFWRLADGTLIPMHDEMAMATAIELISLISPHQIVNVGDFWDFAEWSSKFAVLPEFVLVTQPALDRGHMFLAEQKAAAAATLERHLLLEGNHDDRIARLILQNAKAALRLRQACTPPESWPVMSIPHLARLDALDVEYVGAYPAGRVKIADAHGRQAPLVVLHGERLDMGKQARAERQSSVQGHAHHVAVSCETYEVDSEPVEVEAWSIGCLCRLDGAVPSTKGGSTAHGRPAKRQESWQQAIAVVTETDDGWDIEPIRIRDGRALYRGVTVRAAA